MADITTTNTFGDNIATTSGCNMMACVIALKSNRK